MNDFGLARFREKLPFRKPPDSRQIISLGGDPGKIMLETNTFTYFVKEGRTLGVHGSLYTTSEQLNHPFSEGARV